MSGASRRCVLIGAGGSGGHVYPGLALAQALVEQAPATEVVMVGSPRGLEVRAVPAAGLELELLPVRPLARRLAWQNLLAPFAAVRATFAARALARRRQAGVAVGMGGYVTLPLAAGARLAGVPVVVHEQNAVPGLANRLSARLAAQVAVALPEAAGAFGTTRARVLGNPVRPELRRLDRAALREQARTFFELDPERSTLLVVGGSQGARRLNEAVVAATRVWEEPVGLQILHACGRRDEQVVRAAWAAAQPAKRRLEVRVQPYIERMDLAYAAADVALTRAGAITVAELACAALPAILVPLPHATADHQAANARAFARAGAAVVVADAELDGRRLVAVATPLLSDAGTQTTMAAAMRALAQPDAAAELAALVLATRLPGPAVAPAAGAA